MKVIRNVRPQLKSSCVAHVFVSTWKLLRKWPVLDAIYRLVRCIPMHSIPVVTVPGANRLFSLLLWENMENPDYTYSSLGVGLMQRAVHLIFTIRTHLLTFCASNYELRGLFSVTILWGCMKGSSLSGKEIQANNNHFFKPSSI